MTTPMSSEYAIRRRVTGISGGSARGRRSALVCETLAVNKLAAPSALTVTCWLVSRRLSG
jgi:hypothetical protein